MNDPDDLYYCTYGELVNGQKYRPFVTDGWRTAEDVGGSDTTTKAMVVQAQRWVDQTPPPVMVEIEADVLVDALNAWGSFGVAYDRDTDRELYSRHRRLLWDAIDEARAEARR